MKLLRRLGIRQRILLSMMVGTATALLLFLAALFARDVGAFRDQRSRELAVLSEALSSDLVIALRFQDRTVAENVLAVVANDADIELAWVGDADGRLFASYARQDVGSRERAEWFEGTRPADPRRILVARPLAHEGGAVGQLSLLSGTGELDRRLLESALVAALLAAAAFVAILPLAGWLERTIARPLLAIAGTAREIAEGNDYSLRVAVSSEDELGVLATSFNQMVEQVARREKQLEEARDELEDRVRERTTGLQSEVERRARSEEALRRRTAELARSNAELQQFAYIASHDLREPLRTIAGFVQLLEKRYRGQLDDTADEFIGFVLDGVNRMDQLLTGLLEYSRVGTQALDPQPVDLSAVLSKSIADLKRSIEESGAAIEHDPLPTVMAHEIQLAQLFQNLLGNAIKFCDDEPPRIEISAQRDGASWQLAVRDHGIGVDPRFAERIFLIFQRLHTRDKYAGTGIGLAICKKIVERWGGRIWVESPEDGGVRVAFTLPAAVATTLADAPATGPTTDHDTTAK